MTTVPFASTLTSIPAPRGMSVEERTLFDDLISRINTDFVENDWNGENRFLTFSTAVSHGSVEHVVKALSRICGLEDISVGLATMGGREYKLGIVQTRNGLQLAFAKT